MSNVVVVQTGAMQMVRSGKAGNEETFPLAWVATRDAGDGLPGIVAQGASRGTLFTQRLTGRQLQRMQQEVERLVAG